MAPLLTDEEAALDPYALLSLPASADEKAIRKAYRQQSLKYHPDRNPDPAAAVKFREISLALEILVDGSKRAYVDTKLEGERKRKERYAELDKKWKKLVDDLVAREEDAKKARVEQVERGKRAQDEERVREEGRRLMEEAKARRAAQSQSQAATRGESNGQASTSTAGPSSSAKSSMNGSNGHGSSAARPSIPRPVISASDLSLTLTIPPKTSSRGDKGRGQERQSKSTQGACAIPRLA